jgi:thioredoxin reductase
MMSGNVRLPVAVIGAGPVGLAAAAQLATRGMDFVVLESGPAVGASIRDWAHVRLFSPWRFNTDPAACALLEETGWTPPDPQALPTGGDLVHGYLTPLAAHPAIAARLRLHATVTAITRHGHDKVRTTGRDAAPFLLRLSGGQQLAASAVIDASGTWRTPNPLGGNGIPALGEPEAISAGRVLHGMPDVLGSLQDRFTGRSIAVVGAGHSATGTLISLAQLTESDDGISLHWVLRAAHPSRAYGGGEADALPARGAIGTRIRALVEAGKVTVHSGFLVHEVTPQGLVSDDGRKVDAEVIVNSTGARPDLSPTTELRLDLDPILGSTRSLAPLIDPNHHSCGTVPPHGVDELCHPEKDFYIVGAKSYGRAPTFLLATGYEQARSVVAALAGDWQAAREVKLVLPDTGVCSSGAPGEDAACCGSAPDPQVKPAAVTLPVLAAAGFGNGNSR